tara:strand:- start:370 stop:756 length:387 start_codon:yes stop_codon:yes gene_type:complete
MDLVKLLLKFLYFIAIFVILQLSIKSLVGFRGSQLIIIVVALSTLITHYTFDKAYKFMKKTEILIKTGKKKKKKTITTDDESDDESEDEDDDEVVVKVHKKKSSSNFLLDHTHNFIQNKVFNEDEFIV